MNPHTLPPPAAASRPEYIRLPKAGALCPWTGLSRSKLWELLKKGDVHTICLRKHKTAKRGARLIKLASLLAYLDKLPVEQVAGTSTDEEGED